MEELILFRLFILLVSVALLAGFTFGARELPCQEETPIVYVQYIGDLEEDFNA